MGQRTTTRSVSRGNRRTRGGAGRHNLRSAELRAEAVRVRICLGCNRPFRSRGPWNRFCGRCHLREDESEPSATAYHVPGEWPTAILRDDDF